VGGAVEGWRSLGPGGREWTEFLNILWCGVEVEERWKKGKARGSSKTVYGDKSF